ncbi:MAG: tetratricopeptide repeat protein [Gammaproteobacteria bacterium]|nr:tetratricopeptide repeat protein [Gammaproteobacteria bacterium]
MQQQKTINTVFQSRIAVIIIALSGVFLSSCNYFETEQAKLKKAADLYEENKFNESIFRLKSILQSDPDNCEARILLGKNQFAKYSLLDAQESFTKAMHLGCHNNDLFQYSVRLQMYLNKIPQAQSLYSDPKFASAVNDPGSVLLLGDVYFLLGDYDKAKSEYDKYYATIHDEPTQCLSLAKLSALKQEFQSVIEKTEYCEKLYASNPKYNLDQSRYLRVVAQINLKHEKSAEKNLELIEKDYRDNKDPNIKIQSALLLMKIYVSKKDVAKANEMADILLRYVAIPDVYYVKGLKAEQEHRQDLAEQQFQEALKLNPKHKPTLLALAELKFKEGNVEQAKYYADKADALAGGNIYTSKLDELLAIKYLQAGDLDSIINLLPHNTGKDSPRAQYILALAYAKKKERDKAYDVFRELKKHFDSKERTDLLEARLNVAMGDYVKAEDIFKKYVNKGNLYAVTGLAQLYFIQRNYAAAEGLLKDASKGKDKQNITLLLANLYAQTNQKQKLFDLLKEAVRNERDNRGYRLALAISYYQFEMYENAIKESSDILNTMPEVAQAYIIKANSYIRLGQYDHARATYDDLIVHQPENAFAYVMLAILSDKQGRHDVAMAYINKSLKINPRYLDAIYIKLGLLLDQNKVKESLDFANSTSGLFDDKQTKYLLDGFIYGMAGDDKNAYRSLRAALDAGAKDISIAIRAYHFSMAVNGADKANGEIKEFLAKNHSLHNLYAAAGFFLNLPDYPMAEKYYEEYTNKDQENPVVYNNLAWLKMNSGDNSSARDYADKALRLAPESPEIMDTMGQLLLKMGEYDDAGEYLKKAYQKIGHNPSVQYHLAQYFFYKKDYPKSKELLEAILNKKFNENDDAKKLLDEINHYGN